ncbi:hypothetical protein OZX68_01880 [Streptococcaceae bacterium ESL0729]|nr:hypothetical protein OZX68_01880 [Streptococcaceae bacterium ESL0729]
MKKILENFTYDLLKMSKDSQDLFKDQKDLRRNKKKIKREIFEAQVAGLQLKRDYKDYQAAIEEDLKGIKDSQERLKKTISTCKENIKKLD